MVKTLAKDDASLYKLSEAPLKMMLAPYYEIDSKAVLKGAHTVRVGIKAALKGSRTVRGGIKAALKGFHTVRMDIKAVLKGSRTVRGGIKAVLKGTLCKFCELLFRKR